MEQANTPTLDALKELAPRRWRMLKAHGTAVGLPTDAGVTLMGVEQPEWMICSWTHSLAHQMLACPWFAAPPLPADMGNSEVRREPPCCARATHLSWWLAVKAAEARACLDPACPPSCLPALLQVGHNALGAGQIVDQGAKCVDGALATGGRR